MKRLKWMAGAFIAVLLATGMLFPCSMAAASEKKEKEPEDIVTTVSNDSNLSTLVALLKAAGLIDALEGEGPFTVFAPSNEAFQKLPAGTVTELLRPENKEKLEGILTYHVYSGKVLSNEAAKLANQEIVMLNNKKVKITLKDNNLYINNAKVTGKDIKASNGIIHIIDNVLLPSE